MIKIRFLLKYKIYLTHRGLSLARMFFHFQITEELLIKYPKNPKTAHAESWKLNFAWKLSAQDTYGSTSLCHQLFSELPKVTFGSWWLLIAWGYSCCNLWLCKSSLTPSVRARVLLATPIADDDVVLSPTVSCHKSSFLLSSSFHATAGVKMGNSTKGYQKT